MVQHRRDDIPDLGLQRGPFSCLARMKLVLFASLGYCGEKERCSRFNLLSRVTKGHAHSLYSLYTSEHRQTQVMFTLRGIPARLLVSSWLSSLSSRLQTSLLTAPHPSYIPHLPLHFGLWTLQAK